MQRPLKGFTPYKEEDADRYTRKGWWSGLTFGDILDQAAERHPDKVAIIDKVHRLTYAQLRDLSNKTAIALMDLPLAPTDRVLLQLPNWYEFAIVYFGIQKAGLIETLLIHRYRPYEIGHLVRLSGATTWVVPETYQKTDYLPIISEVLAENPGLQNVILVRGNADTPYLNLETLIEAVQLTEENLDRLSRRRPDPMQVSHMGPTGGTTGLPKIVPRTHNDLICASKYCAQAWDMSEEDRCLVAGPVGHDLCFSKGFLGSLLTGGTTVFLDSVNFDHICGTIQKEKITSVVWVPTLARRLVKFERLDRYDLSSLQRMHCGGGTSQPDMIRDVMEKLGCRYHNGYGATEGMTALTRTDDPIETILDSVGKPTCPHDTYRIVDFKDRQVPVGTSGELQIKGPGVFTGYYNNPEENQKVFSSDGFFKTGDMANIDADGNIRLTGRIKEMINRGGESISAVEIEKLICAHPQVQFVGVVPMPDKDLGERVCAYIQTIPGVNLDFEAIISFLKSRHVSVLQLPERIEFVKEIPMTKASKIDKQALKKDIAEKISAGV
jgi:2,3-dihydroxybenzoate-AMP ligase/mycobactin salicyl-AMP ligase